MASYSKDDFVTGSDLSDLSDISEDDLDINDVLDTDDESEDDGSLYCVCGKPSTTEMIACDDDHCTVIWWHYECAGVSVETIPDGSWLCQRCLPSAMPSGSGGSPGRNLLSDPSASNHDVPVVSEPFTDTSDSAIKRPNKSTTSRKKGKPAAKRPKAVFTVEDARQNACKYMRAGLEQARQNPVFTARYPIALCLMSFVIQLLTVVDTPEFQDFCIATMTALWMVVTAGDAKNLKPEAYEAIWGSFHKFRVDSVGKWKEFLTTLNMYEEGQHVNILYQYLLQFVVDLLIKERNKSDLQRDDPPLSIEPKPITKEEEQVLRYVAGYIPYALNKKLKNQANTCAQTFCKFLKSWQVCCSNTAKTFLEYTNQWIDVQNRGGLFHVSDGVYLLFRNMELETRRVLTVENLDAFPGVDVQTQIAQKIKAHHRVQNYWCTLTQGKIGGDVSGKLLDMVIMKWIKIRAKAFINVYLNLKKRSGGVVSKKAEKALRKDL